MRKRGRPDREDYFAIGMLLLIVMIIWSSYTYQICGTVFDRCALEPIRQWQTLIAGTMASLAAVVTVFNIRKQIAQTDKLEKNRRQNRVQSQKAMLAHVLTNISTMLNKDINILRNPPSDTIKIDELQWRDEIPSYFEIIRDVIEFEDSFPDIRQRLSDLVLELQTYRSRREPSTIPIDTAYREKITLIANNIYVHAFSNSLFDYARNKNNLPKPITYEYLCNIALQPSINFSESTDPEIFDELKVLANNKTDQLN